MYSNIVLVGRLGNDPTLKYTPTGKAVCDFSLAVERVKGSGESRISETMWWRITLWEQRAETASNNLHKGSKVLVQGSEVKASAYMDKQNKPAASLELTASEFRFLDNKEDNQSQSRRDTPIGDSDPMDIPF